MELSKYMVLLHKRLKGEIDPNEDRALQEWLDTQPDKELEQQLRKSWELSGDYKKDYEPDVEQGLADFKARLRLAPKPAARRLHPPRRRRSWWAAAATLLLLLAGIWWWAGASGQDGAAFVRSTSSGQTKEFKLPDGSSVLLNESSYLAYSMLNGERMLQLAGEAFFSVAPDADHPFIIESKGTRTVALGTAFNLRAYPEELTVEIEVVEGKVKFLEIARERSIPLKAQQRGICKPSEGKLYKKEVNAYNARSWHTDELIFQEATFGEALTELERYFNAELQLKNAELRKCPYNGAFKLDDRSLQNLVESLELVFGLEARHLQGRAYVLEGGRCE
jgi:transmembrane sensor